MGTKSSGGGLGAGALIGGVASLLNTGVGLLQGAKARKLERNLVRPTQTVQNEFVKNAAEAEGMARTGMSQQQYNAGQVGIGRNMTTGLRALNNRANPINGINSLVRAGNDATNNLNVQDANIRRQNMLNAQNQRSILGGQKQQAWNWNSRDNYGEQLARVQALRGAQMQNIGNGINNVANLGMITSQGQMIGSGEGFDETYGGNFTPNSVGFLGRMFGKKRQQYIGARPQSVGYNIKPLPLASMGKRI